MNRQQVIDLFSNLRDDSDAFFAHVADDVDWTVMGSHPLAGRYRSKQAFFEHTFARLAKALPDGAKLTVEHALVDGDTAAVELVSDVRANNGIHFVNRYCCVCRFRGEVIVEVRVSGQRVGERTAAAKRGVNRSTAPARAAPAGSHRERNGPG